MNKNKKKKDFIPTIRTIYVVLTVMVAYVAGMAFGITVVNYYNDVDVTELALFSGLLFVVSVILLVCYVIPDKE